MAARTPASTQTPGENMPKIDETSIVVQDGDTWAVVADRAGVDVGALVAANGGQAGQPLIVGEALVRP